MTREEAMERQTHSIDAQGTGRSGGGAGNAARAALVFTVYLAGYLALDAVTEGIGGSLEVSLWFPPVGLTLALLLVFGWRYAPAVAAVFALHLLFFRDGTDYPIWLIVGIPGVYAVLYAGTAALLLGPAGIDPRLPRARDVVWFVGMACFAAPFLVALVTVFGFVTAGYLPADAFWSNAMGFWAGDATGIAVVGPLALVALRPFPALWTSLPRTPVGETAGDSLKPTRREAPKVVAQALALVVALAAAYSVARGTALDYAYLAFAPVTWVALRGGFERAVVALLAVNVGVVILLERAPGGVDPVLLQFGLMTLTLVGLLFGAVTSERRRAEGALRESHDLLRTVLEGSTDAVYVKDAGGRYLMINSVGARMLGRSVGQIIGRDDTQLFKPEYASRVMAEDREVMSTGETRTYEEHKAASAAGTRTYLTTRGPYRQRGGGPVGVFGVSRDITERKEAEERLKESEESQRRRARELDLLHRVRTALSSEIHPGAVCRAVVEAVAEAYGYALVGAYLLEAEDHPGKEGELVLQHQVGYDTVIERIPLGHGVSGRAVRAGRTVLIEDVREEPAFLGAIEGIVSEICVPLFDDGEAVGFLNVESTGGTRLTEDDLWLLEAVGEHVGTALEQARLHGRAREAEERYRALVENIPAVVYVDDVDETNSVIYRSPYVREVLGYEPEEFLSGPDFWHNLLHPDDRERVLAEDERTGETGEPFREEFRMAAKDGSVVWLREEGNLVRTEADGTQVWHGVMYDITELKQVEWALKEAEQRYRTLVEQIPAVTYIQEIHHSHTALYVSPQIERLTGHPPKAYYANPGLWYAMVHPEDLDRVVAEDDRTDLSGEAFFAEYRLIHRDGRTVWVRDEAALVEGDRGRPGYWQGVMLDITERKEAEGALRESEERFRSLVQNASDMISILDPDGTIRYVSPSVERVLGYRPEERVGADAFGEETHPDDTGQMWEALAEGLARPGGVSRPLRFRVRHKDGSWRHLEAVAANRLDHPAVGGIVVNARDVTERKAYEERLAYQATHNPLTGLPNRRLFVERLQRALSGAGGRGERVAVLFLDLDDFKYVNDSLGHEAGDRLLVAAAERIQECLQPGDTVARLGGDEFAVLIEDTEEAGGASCVAERIDGALRAAPFEVSGRQAFVGASIGVVRAGEVDGLPGAVIKGADLAMYEAKRKGKARHVVFDAETERRFLRRLEMDIGLRRALEQDDLILHYQPLVALRSGRIVGFEALVRWQHPEHGLVLPGEFVPLAEENGMILPIGRWVLAEACRQARDWQKNGPQGSSAVVGVNLSAKQLSSHALVEDVERAFSDAGLDPDRLTLEITESALVDGDGRHIEVLERIEGLGVRLAIDDFGTGYSSLSYLGRLPSGMLKLDGSFLSGVGQGSEDEVVLSGIVGIAHGLDLLVCAEGVETPGQAARARELGCDLAQGHHFSAPLPGEAATNLWISATGDDFRRGR